LQSRVEVIDYNDQYLLEQQNLHGVCASGNEHYLAAIDRLLQQRDGAMLPLISELSLTAVMPRLLSEKVISTDTTAAGGNASLLVMED
jgi:RHH-type proline utilization regulon transcriptional repressor/proline dehydrogenase/delta 1-pyrroline-5-carboxylate dehydrogenase